MRSRRLMTTLTMVLILMFSAVSAGADGPKYVFFFLGDGMASAQIQATEAYLTTAATAATATGGRAICSSRTTAST